MHLELMKKLTFLVIFKSNQTNLKLHTENLFIFRINMRRCYYNAGYHLKIKNEKTIIIYLCFSYFRWKYKEEYEKFKYVVTTISMCLSFLLLFLKPYRVLDAVLNFLLVWYYCTLTIRESILVINGSK